MTSIYYIYLSIYLNFFGISAIKVQPKTVIIINNINNKKKDNKVGRHIMTNIQHCTVKKYEYKLI